MLLTDKDEGKFHQWHDKLQPNLKGQFCVCMPRPKDFKFEVRVYEYDAAQMCRILNTHR